MNRVYTARNIHSDGSCMTLEMIFTPVAAMRFVDYVTGQPRAAAMYEPRVLSFLWLLLIFDINVNATSVILCAAMDDLFDFDVYDVEPDTVDGEHSQATASSHVKAKTSKPKSGCKRLLKKDKLSIASKLRAVDSYLLCC